MKRNDYKKTNNPKNTKTKKSKEHIKPTQQVENFKGSFLAAVETRGGPRFERGCVNGKGKENLTKQTDFLGEPGGNPT